MALLSEYKAGNVSSFSVKTTTYTVALKDAASVIALSGSSAATTLSCVIPSNNFPAGFSFSVTRFGSSRVVFKPESDVIFRTAGVSYEIASQYSIGSVVYSGVPANGWLVFGDLV